MLMSEYDYNLDIETQREEAEEIGIAVGKRIMIFQLVSEGEISLSKGANKLNISEDELKQEMVEKGYTFS